MIQWRSKAFGLRAWQALAFVVLLAGVAAAMLGSRQGPSPLSSRPEAERSTLLLLSTLPLVFPEDFTLEAGGSPALTALERRYKVEPINIADSASLAGHDLLLLAHPLAQPAEALVALDQWVRSGGRVVLLADPRLDWPSKRPLGDRLRPPPAFADTGLLRHWRLTLEAPDGEVEEERTVDGRVLRLDSSGRLAGACAILGDGLVARCSIGRGKATVIADADFLRVDDPDSDELQFLLAELDLIERG